MIVVPYSGLGQRLGSLATVMLVAVIVAVIAYDQSDLYCRRTEPGAIPHCDGRSGILSSTVLSFAYATPDTLKVTVRIKNGRRRTVVETPAGDLRGAVDNLNAPTIVADAMRFRNDPNALSWETHPRLDITRGALLVGGFICGLLLALRRPKRVVVDPLTNRVFVHPSRPVALDTVKSVRVDRNYHEFSRGTLTIRTADRQFVELVQGELTALRAVAAALDGATVKAGGST